jgi:hypothetical protein
MKIDIKYIQANNNYEITIVAAASALSEKVYLTAREISILRKALMVAMDKEPCDTKFSLFMVADIAQQ